MQNAWCFYLIFIHKLDPRLGILGFEVRTDCHKNGSHVGIGTLDSVTITDIEPTVTTATPLSLVRFVTICIRMIKSIKTIIIANQDIP